MRESIDIREYGIPHVKSVSLIEKVRVVNALIGFSRLNPIMNKEDKGFVSIKEPRTRWYPAYEVRGEGIFIEFRAISEKLFTNSGKRGIMSPR